MMRKRNTIGNADEMSRKSDGINVLFTNHHLCRVSYQDLVSSFELWLLGYVADHGD